MLVSLENVRKIGNSRTNWVKKEKLQETKIDEKKAKYSFIFEYIIIAFKSSLMSSRVCANHSNAISRLSYSSRAEPSYFKSLDLSPLQKAISKNLNTRQFSPRNSLQVYLTFCDCI